MNLLIASLGILVLVLGSYSFAKERPSRCAILEALYTKYNGSSQAVDPKYVKRIEEWTRWYNKNCTTNK